MGNSRAIYGCSGLLFALAALVTAMEHSHNMGMVAVWLALSAVFLALSQTSKNRA